MMKFLSGLIASILMMFPFEIMAQDGYPASWQLGLQNAVSPVKQEIFEFHGLLLWIVTAITIVVTALLLFAIIRYRRRKNVEPATFAHNTLIEVLWTLVPVIILGVIAVPSFKLLYFEDRIPTPELTIKATGYQWYWGYEYMDYDGLEFLSYPIADEDIDEDAGQRRLLSTDVPVVVPVGKNIQILVTAADVLHAFALPAAGVKKDAVPGQLNQTWMRIDKPGTYFGQCSEICGTGHSYMPIEVRAVPEDEFNAWVAEMGGTLKTPASEAADVITDEERNADILHGEIQDIENSETKAADSVENKRDNPKVDESNIANPGQ